MSVERIQGDIQRTVYKGIGSKKITLETPSGDVSVSVHALVSKHSMAIDPATGMPVNTRTAHFSVTEGELLEKEYPYKTSDNEIVLKDHKAIIKIAGKELTYLINSAMPSETMGVIVCTLGRYVT